MNKKSNLDLGWQEVKPDRMPFLQSPSEGKLVSTFIPAPGLSAWGFLRHAEGQERFFWQNGCDPEIVCGFGVAVEMMAWGETRFDQIKRQAASLFANAYLDLNLDSDVGPRMFGGFAFRDDFTPDNTWSVFHPAHFILPHFQLIQSDKDSWLVINAVIPLEEELYSVRDQLKIALNARYETLLRAVDITPVDLTNEPFAINFPMSYETWAEMIRRAVTQIKETDLEKVVLARACELRSKRRINVIRALEYLNQNYDECARFLFEPRPFHAFYGATPEILVQIKGKNLKTMALAGSMRRGRDPVEDSFLAQELKASKKDRHEHKLVVDSIVRRINPWAAEILKEEEPQIYTLSYIHHLLTPITVALKEPVGALTLVELLHPTPALGGSPREKALEFIRNAEPVPRGWFAGPVGWIDHEMNGEFAVAIRSTVAQERRVWFYAGAGIVADSIPVNEWAETALKFQPMFAALGQQLTETYPVAEVNQ